MTGDRYYDDVDSISDILGTYRKKNSKLKIIQGGAGGADTIALAYAERFGLEKQTFKADWEKYGKGAGPIRNQEMLDQGDPSLVLAFHNDIRSSKGTKDMIRRSVKNNILTILVSKNLKITRIDKLNLEDELR